VLLILAIVVADEEFDGLLGLFADFGIIDEQTLGIQTLNLLEDLRLQRGTHVKLQHADWSVGNHAFLLADIT
jgi:hypothetical protein